MAKSLNYHLDTHFISSLFIQFRKYFLTFCLKVFKLSCFLINSGKLFHPSDQRIK